MCRENWQSMQSILVLFVLLALIMCLSVENKPAIPGRAVISGICFLILGTCRGSRSSRGFL